MDDWVTGFVLFGVWIILFQNLIITVLAVFIGKYISKKVIKDGATRPIVKKNLIIVATFYVLSVIFYFNPRYLIYTWRLAVYLLPFSSAVLFVVLELFEGIKRVLTKRQHRTAEETPVD